MQVTDRHDEPSRRSRTPTIVHYFVDEAGTPTLFGRRRKAIVDEPGASAYFMLGAHRYWEFVRPKAKLIYDIDDTRQNRYGVYYTPTQPLTKDARAKK